MGESAKLDYPKAVPEVMHVDPASGEGSTCVIPGESHLDAARLPRFGRPRDVGMEVSRGRSRAKFLGYNSWG